MHFPFRALITCVGGTEEKLCGAESSGPQGPAVCTTSPTGVLAIFPRIGNLEASIQSSSTLCASTTAWQRAGISRTRANSFSVPIASQASFRASHTTNDSVSQNQANTAYRPGVIVAHTSDGYLRDAYR
jgi:hypothetical protein